MPSAVAAGQKPTHDDLDNYGVDDLSDDPFASPSPQSKKRKEPASSSNALGIDEEVSVQKRARVPAVKLDEDRLLGPAGIPRLRQRASRNLKIKGKGHEFSDAARLLSFYQLWLDDLFPKARFLDALAMVEKAGHKKRVMTARNEWINEARPRSGADEDENGDDARENGHAGSAGEADGTDVANDRPERPQTPLQDVPGDDDLYDATPRARTATRRDVPEEDDLDALIAEAEGQDSASNRKKQATTEPDEDDLDVLIAEAEGEDGAGSSNAKAASSANNEFADEEAAMQEMDGLW